MKKYSDKFINQIDQLKYAIVGFEFEFYLRELSYYKTLEILNEYLKPVKVWGFRKYHSSFKVDENNFKLEPDLSGGPQLCELITGPLDYFSAKYFLVKILKFINDYGYTNDRCSIHFNISFDSEYKNLNDLNILKLILNIDEEEIYRNYPSRNGNVYAKSVKKLIPIRDYDYFNVPIDTVKNNIRLPNDKYYGVNFLHITKETESQRLEFRYIGGKDYEKNSGKLIYFMERFIINSYESIDTNFNSTDIEKLEEYLEENITKYRNLASYDNFIIEFPTINIQIDQNNDYDVVSSYYTNIYNEVYELAESIEEFKECIINYVTTTQTIELVDAKIKTTSIISSIDIINSEVEGILKDCHIVNSTIRNSQVSKSKLSDCDAYETKILNCNVDASELNNCYFMAGYLNGSMFGGVFRSGELGPYAVLDSDVKIIRSEQEGFFNTKYGDEDDEKSYKKNVLGFFDKGE